MNNISSSTQVPITVPAQAPALEEVEKEFSQFYTALKTLQEAADKFPQEKDDETDTLIRATLEQLAIVEKKVRDKLKTATVTYKADLDSWHKLSSALLTTYETFIQDSTNMVQENCADCLEAYKLIEGSVTEDASFIQLHNKARAPAIASIQKSILERLSSDLVALCQTLRHNEQLFRIRLRNFTMEKIKVITNKLDAISSLFGNLLNEGALDPFALTPYPILTALDEERNFKTITPEQMLLVRSEIDLRKKFFRQIYLLNKEFLSDTYPLKERAQQFVRAQTELAKSRQTIEKEFPQSKSPSITDSINQLPALGPLSPSPHNELMGTRQTSPTSLSSPTSMVISPSSVSCDDEKSPLPVHFTQADVSHELTLDTHTSSHVLEISPTHAKDENPWHLTLIRAYKKHAPQGIKKANKHPAIKFPAQVSKFPAPAPLKFSAIEQAAKRICSFIRQVETASKQQHFVSINGQDILEDDEVAAVLTAIKNFGVEDGPVSSLLGPVLQLLRDRDQRPVIVDLFFCDPDPDTFFQELQEKILLTPAAAGKLFSLPENAVREEVQKQNPPLTNVFLADKKIVERLAALRTEVQQPNLFALSCEAISAKWDEIVTSHISLVDTIYSDAPDLDICFELQNTLYQRADELSSLIGDLSRKIASQSSIKLVSNTTST